MNIDWFTFVAQILNFLVLVVVLRWSLYGPIIRAMERREAEIANRLQEADQQHEQAESKVQEYEQKLERLDEQREQMLGEAREDAHEEHQRILHEARGEVERKREQWHEAYRREQEDLHAEVRRLAGHMGVAAARQMLSELAGAALEDQMRERFTSQLQQMDDEQRQQLRRHVGGQSTEVAVRSAHELPEEQQSQLRGAIQELLNDEAEVTFERSPDLICGLELDVGGYVLGWNVREFLNELEFEWGERLKKHEHAQ